MLGTSYPVTQRYISEQSPVLNREIVQYGLLLPGSRVIQILGNSTFMECELSKTGDTKLKVHLERQATEVNVITNCFLRDKYWKKADTPPFMQNFYTFNIKKLTEPLTLWLNRWKPSKQNVMLLNLNWCQQRQIWNQNPQCTGTIWSHQWAGNVCGEFGDGILVWTFALSSAEARSFCGRCSSVLNLGIFKVLIALLLKIFDSWDYVHCVMNGPHFRGS